MPNAFTHRLGAGTAVGLISLVGELGQGKETNLGWPVVATALATATARLPDMIEPATNPGHRGFFHSITFAGLVGYGAYRLHGWQPQDDLQKALRFTGLVVGGTYLVHLLMDACTPGSLPLV